MSKKVLALACMLLGSVAAYGHNEMISPLRALGDLFDHGHNHGSCHTKGHEHKHTQCHTDSHSAKSHSDCGDCFSFMKDLAVSTSVGYESEYVFRGGRLARQNAQYEVSLAHPVPVLDGQLSASIWHLTPINDTKDDFVSRGCNSEELDLTLDYGMTFCENVGVNVGFIYYWFPNAGGIGTSGVLNREREIYGTLSYDFMGFMPSFTVDYNFDREQWLFLGELGYSFDLEQLFGCSGLAIDLNGYMGILCADEYNGNQRVAGVVAHGNGYTYLGGSVDLVWQINDCFSLNMGPRFSYNNDDDASSLGGANALGDHDTNFWWGIHLVADF